MPGPQPTPIALTERQDKLLAAIVNGSTSEQRLVYRGRIILEIAATGGSNTEIATRLACTRPTVRKWRQRWLDAQKTLLALESDETMTDTALRREIEAVLADADRPGAPPTFSAEQVAQIIALACETPEHSDRPSSHWSNRDAFGVPTRRWPGVLLTRFHRTVSGGF